MPNYAIDQTDFDTAMNAATASDCITNLWDLVSNGYYCTLSNIGAFERACHGQDDVYTGEGLAIWNTLPIPPRGPHF